MSRTPKLFLQKRSADATRIFHDLFCSCYYSLRFFTRIVRPIVNLYVSVVIFYSYYLDRIFGFLNWSWDVTSADLMYEEKGDRNWEVGYRVIGTLSVNGATYTEAAVGMAHLPQRGEAHDMAVKTGESDAIKRAAINLGDQFGLSLYNNGSTQPVVVQTLEGDSNE